MDAEVRKKISSQKKEILEGSEEWDVFYRKYYAEEMRRMGIVHVRASSSSPASTATPAVRFCRLQEMRGARYASKTPRAWGWPHEWSGFHPAATIQTHANKSTTQTINIGI